MASSLHHHLTTSVHNSDYIQMGVVARTKFECDAVPVHIGGRRKLSAHTPLLFCHWALLFTQRPGLGRTELNKRNNERIYTPDQWLQFISGARRCKPFKSVLADQSIFLSFSSHFSALFKKTVKKNKKSLNIQKARVLDYSVTHSNDVWVKYTASKDASFLS